MIRIMILDNYDSFTYNLVQIIEDIMHCKIDVYRNDMISVEEVNKYDKIVLSPGPGLPDESGILKELIKAYAPHKSIFGVCLGLQAIAETFGGELINLDKVFHGVSSKLTITDKEEPLFEGIPGQFYGGRYHSWVVNKNKLPDCLKVTAVEEEGMIMALSHKTFNVRGVQFHPESFMTREGSRIIANWLKL